LRPPEAGRFALNAAYCRSFYILAIDGHRQATKELFASPAPPPCLARFGRSDHQSSLLDIEDPEYVTGTQAIPCGGMSAMSQKR